MKTDIWTYNVWYIYFVRNKQNTRQCTCKSNPNTKRFVFNLCVIINFTKLFDNIYLLFSHWLQITYI